jgi:NAD(P)-dependent dehydrogenase (short-subunit alcohol dehydrogenase family)
LRRDRDCSLKTMKKSIALITGGTRGLGLEISRELARAGYSVIAVYGNDDESAAALLAEGVENGWELQTRKVDLGSLDQVADLFRSLPSEDRLEILVNNASPGFTPTQFHKWTMEDFGNLLNVNVTASFRMCQLAIPRMKTTGRGRIINILSANTLGNPAVGSSGYVVAKYALLGLTRSLAVEYAKNNITANAISPGAMECGIFEAWPEILREMVLQQTPYKRAIDPSKVAKLVGILVSTSGDAINGCNLPVTEGAAV